MRGRGCSARTGWWTREGVVDPADEVVLVAGNVRSSRRAADPLRRLRRRLPRRQRIELQHRRHRRMHADVHAVDDAVTRVGVGHGDRLRLADRLPQPLVGDEVERLVRDQRAAELAPN